MHHQEEQHYHGEQCGCGEHHQQHHQGHHRGEQCGCGEHHQQHHQGHPNICGCHRQQHYCQCGCHSEGHQGFSHGISSPRGFRRFISREEIVKHLENYLKELQAESKAVTERIEELKKKGDTEQISEIEAT